MRTRCRACDREGLHDILPLGQLPLANALRPVHGLDEPEARFPLTLALCPACSLVQIRETVAPRLLFTEYPYFSSYAATTLTYADALAAELIARHDLGPHSRVIEIGSNDGYLLAPFQARGIPVLGIEPARNIAAVAVARGIPTEAEFFGTDTAVALIHSRRQCDLLIGNNVLAHVADLPGFVAAARSLLRPGGHAVFEFPYLGDMLAHGEFDTIYHEHLCYFSLTAVSALCRRHGLHLARTERLPRHGGSLRITLALQPPTTPCAQSHELLAEETAAHWHEVAAYRPFVAMVERIRRDLPECLAELRSVGLRVAAYGASAKGSTLMNCCGLGRQHLDFVVDRSPHKQGRLTPGNHLPIVAPEQILAVQPDCLLLLAWNFADEILAQQAEYRRRGGRFLLPLPEVRFL